MRLVFGESVSPLCVCVTHDVLMMYTSCSRTDSPMRTIVSPASFRVTLAFPRGTPRLRKSHDIPPAHEIRQAAVTRAWHERTTYR